MKITIREYQTKDAEYACKIWNEVIEDGNAFPQENVLDETEADEFFKSQSYTGIAEDENSKICGLYILHPNNIGRCGHIANASYAVEKNCRGLHIGEKIVKDCLNKAHELGFKILQFNAVVASNIHALHLYKRLGFTVLGTIPNGFRNKQGKYEDIVLQYKIL